MYCKNCGNQIQQNAIVCLSCGCDPHKGNKHCFGCGLETKEEQIICTKCGKVLKNQVVSDEGRTVAIIAYLTLIGFIIALIQHGSSKTRLGAYHLRQVMGFIITSIVLAIILWLITFPMFSMSIENIASYAFFVSIVSIIIWVGLFICILVSFINAINCKEKPAPIFGKLFEKLFVSFFSDNQNVSNEFRNISIEEKVSKSFNVSINPNNGVRSNTKLIFWGFATLIIAVVAVAVFFFKKGTSNDYLFNLLEIDNSLTVSNNNIATANNTLYTSLKAKLTDPMTAEKARPWYEKAEQARILSSELDDFLNELKTDLKNESGFKIVDIDGRKVEEFKKDDLEAATRLFGEGEGDKKKGKELEQKLKAFREAMLNIDPSIRKEFEITFPLDVSKILGQDGKEKDFTTAYFHKIPSVAALTLLSKFQNNVKNAENLIVTYCHNQVGGVKVVYDQFAALVGQSSNYVMPGEEVEITAGVGAYSKAAQPQISIAGSSTAVGPDGRAIYKFKASGSGSKTVPVNVTYTKPDGTKETRIFDVKYMVGTPCQ